MPQDTTKSKRANKVAKNKLKNEQVVSEKQAESKLARMPDRNSKEASDEGRRIKVRMERAKKRAFELEKDNDSKLIAYYSGKNWYKIGGISALVYTHMVAPRLELSPNLRPDSDLEYKFVEGIVSVRSIDELAENLEKIGIKIVSQDDYLVVFDLGFKVTDAELTAIRSVRKERIAQINTILGSDKSYAGLVMAERKVAMFLRSKMAKAKPYDRDMIMTELARQAITDCATLYAASARKTSAKEALTRVYKNNERAQYYIMILLDMRILTDTDALRLELDLADANRLIKAELKRMDKKAS